MRVTMSNGKITLFCWDAGKLRHSLDQYKNNGYVLDYMRDELYRTKVGPMRVYTAILSPEVTPNFIGARA